MNKYYFTTQLNTIASPHPPPGTGCLTTIFILSLLIRFTIKATMKTLRPHTQKTEKILSHYWIIRAKACD